MMQPMTIQFHSFRSASGLSEFVAFFGALPFVGECWHVKEYNRGVMIGCPSVFANEAAAKRSAKRRAANAE